MSVTGTSTGGDWGADDRPRVLAVTTTFREGEVTGPMEHVPGTTVVIDAEAHPLRRAVDAARGTRRAIREERPDVLLLNGAGVVGVVVALLALVHGVPLVARLVGDPWAVSDREGIARARRQGPRAVAVEYGYLYLSRAVFRLATGFVAVSTELAGRIRERTGVPGGCVEVVPVPRRQVPDGDGDRARERLGVTAPTVLLTVTNLHFRGKYEGVVDALAGLHGPLEARDDLAYVVAGGGPYLDDLRAHVDRAFADSPARDRIHVPGTVEEIFDCYAMATAFLYLSHIDGYPNVVLEAQSAGLPVVTNPAFGMRDMVTDGETGLFVDPKDPDSIGAAVERLLDDPGERERLGEAGRERAARENDPGAVGRRLHAALASILDAAPS